MTATVPSLLQPMKDRLAAATPGPWEVSQGGVVQSFDIAVQTGEHSYEREGIVPAEYVREPDAEFIAAAPTDQAKLIAAIEAVAGLHARDQGFPNWCQCGEMWPCAVIDALTQALGGDTA